MRIVVITNVQPLAERLVPFLLDMGHEPVAVIAQRTTEERAHNPRAFGPIPYSNPAPPFGVDLLLPSHKDRLAPLLRVYEPDVTLCWGFGWKIPQEALDVARLGSVNQHPAKLPQHRGPIPFAWAFRDGLSEFGCTWHRMDAELDTGNILAQTTIPILDDDFEIMDFAPRVGLAAMQLLPQVFERLEAGDPGDVQPTEGVSWAGHFEQDDYAEVDLARTARETHNQVRAWQMTFDMTDARGPYLELDGERRLLTRTSLTDPGGDARPVECADGPIWIVSSEPA